MRLACAGLVSWFDKAASIVAPSRLMASFLERQFVRWQLERGKESWKRLQIFSIDAWLAAKWQEARYSDGDVPALLSPVQESILWQTIVEREHPELFDSASTAQLAMRAASLLSEWHIPPSADAWNENADALHFGRWHASFESVCSEHGWMTRAEAWTQVSKWIRTGLCKRELTMFAGFETFSPALRNVMAALGEFAHPEPLTDRKPVQPVIITQRESFEDEIEHAARCARHAFEEQPSRSIAVIVPELRENRKLVERLFQHVFYPSSALNFDAAQSEDCVFHVNAGRPVGEAPLVASALLLTNLLRSRIPTADASAILRCPFVTGAEAERTLRASADLRLRRNRDVDVSFSDMVASTVDCEILATVWPRVRRLVRSVSERLEYGEWRDLFGDLLSAIGWPGEGLSSQEEDLVELWKRTLSDLGSLGMVSAPVRYETAVAALRRLLSARVTETGSFLSPVQVLDPNDAPGLEFDCILVTGISSEAWLPPVLLSPLVPLKLQRAAGVPGSSPENLRNMRERITRSIFSAAPRVAASYSGLLSPLAEPYVASGAPALEQWRGKLPRQSFTPVALDQFEDGEAPPFHSAEVVRGGTGILKSQSLCPFRAFAEYRMRAQTPEEMCLGFDSRDRGGFLHKALQLVWNVLKTHDALRSSPPDELGKLVEDAVQLAVRDDASSPFHRLATDSERRRLEDLILQWLAIERGRHESFSVEMIEEDRFYEVAGLRLKLRIDRIDRLRDGSVLLIDYKSGEQKRAKLEGERP